MHKNTLKEKLGQGKTCVGVWQQIDHLHAGEIQAMAGWDFILYDMEHSVMEFHTVQSMMQIAARFGPTPVIRLAANDPVFFKKALDIGAEGLVVPMVNNQDGAAEAVRYSQYPPVGIRGWGPGRVAGYGLDDYEYFATFAREEILLIVQIETQEGLDNLDEILSVEGIGAALIGPNDLSISLGIKGQFDNSKFTDAVKLLLDKCKKHNIIPGITGVADAEAVKKRADQGFRFIPYYSDIGLLASATRAARAGIEQLGF